MLKKIKLKALPKTSKITVFFLVLVVFHLTGSLLADVVVTTDDMILNGKIIAEEEGGSITLANYHGVFVINYSQIKEIQRTDNYMKDVQVLEERGFDVNEDEVKKSYDAGMEKYEELHKSSDREVKSEIEERSFILFAAPFFYMNFGKLQPQVPCSYGASVSLLCFTEQLLYLSGFSAELDYYYAENDSSMIAAPRILTGPFWQVPVKMHSFTFRYLLSPQGGVGLYTIKGPYSEITQLKPDILLSTGPLFSFSSVAVYPTVKLDCILDNYAPLIGAGLALNIGYIF